jgi:hypothetical protein
MYQRRPQASIIASRLPIGRHGNSSSKRRN